LSAILARDGYMPRVFHARGNRLVFTGGILVLTFLACALLAVFNAKTTHLIPLYALGVFLSFTLSQAGMVRHWQKTKEPGWRRSAIINGFGALTTAVVFAVIVLEKFGQGAWFVCILVPVLAALGGLVGRTYHRLARSLNVPDDAILDFRPSGSSAIPIVVPVQDINLATVMTVAAACERSREVIGVHVLVDPDEPSSVEKRWACQIPNVPLVVIDSPFRTVSDPIGVYVDDMLRRSPHEVTVMVPLLEVRGAKRILVNQSLKGLMKLLAQKRHVNVIRFPFQPGSPARPDHAIAG
jgi:hypothetical protein